MNRQKKHCYTCCAERDYQIVGAGETFVAWESSHVEARGNSHVVVWGSSHVEAWESSHVVARESSHVVVWGSSHVEAWESSHVVARESSHVVAWGSSHVEASKYVSCHIHGQQVKIKGGVQIKIPEIATMTEWCDFYGVEIRKGVAVLFKGVDDDFSTNNARSKGIFYQPGTQPQAPDWDGGKAECGGGLHFSPTPLHTLQFNSTAKHFIACPVRVADIKIPKNADYPGKVKAPGLCAPCYEVDRYGAKISQESMR